jgi:osmotically-inducible protein OsmY
MSNFTKKTLILGQFIILGCIVTANAETYTYQPVNQSSNASVPSYSGNRNFQDANSNVNNSYNRTNSTYGSGMYDNNYSNDSMDNRNNSDYYNQNNNQNNSQGYYDVNRGSNQGNYDVNTNRGSNQNFRNDYNQNFQDNTNMNRNYQDNNSNFRNQNSNFQNTNSTYRDNTTSYGSDNTSTTNNRMSKDANGKVISDEDISKNIYNKIKSGWFTKGYDQVTVQVRNGMVTLMGNVNTWEDKDKVEKEVRKVDGVASINNQITVLNSKDSK